MTSDETTGARALVDALESLGVEIAFGLPGVHNLPIWSALADSRIRLVGVRHEQTSVYAADGYARATGRLGVALTTTGPGAANAVAATGEAWVSHSPVLVVATDIPTSLRRAGGFRGALHETRDQAAMFAPIVKRSFVVALGDEIAGLTIAAAEFASEAPTGPTYLQIPTDLLSAHAQIEHGRHSPRTPSSVSDDLVGGAAAMLDSADQPLIWVGRGAVAANAAEEVLDLAEKLTAPVIETYGARGLAGRHPCAVALPPHVPQAGELWDRADVVLAVGTDFDGMSTQNWLQPQPRRLIAVNVDRADATKNYPADLALVGDAREICALIGELVSPRSADRLVGLHAELNSRREEAMRDVESDEPQAALLLSILDRVLADSDVVFADMCIPGYWAAGFHRFTEVRKLAYPVGWGTLGFAFPASIGGALAITGRTVCLCGDGGFLFAAGELATVAQERVPVTIVVFDDGGYGMLRFEQDQAGEEHVGVELKSPDISAWADSAGIEATSVDGIGEALASALERGLGQPGPSLVLVRASLRPPPTTSPRWYRRSDRRASA
jgi:thiamine pyrophosphate-dependent acetolactate synthase large subunit-like protein